MPCLCNDPFADMLSRFLSQAAQLPFFQVAANIFGIVYLGLLLLAFINKVRSIKEDDE